MRPKNMSLNDSAQQIYQIWMNCKWLNVQTHTYDHEHQKTTESCCVSSYLMMLSSICIRDVAVYSRPRSASIILTEPPPNRLCLQHRHTTHGVNRHVWSRAAPHSFSIHTAIRSCATVTLQDVHCASKTNRGLGAYISQYSTRSTSFKGPSDTCVRGWFSSCCQPWESYRSVWNGPTVGMFPGPWGIETNTQEVSSAQPVCIPNNTVNVLRNPPDKESGWRREQQSCPALVCSSQTEAGNTSNNCRSFTNNSYIQCLSFYYLHSNDVKYKYKNNRVEILN